MRRKRLKITLAVLLTPLLLLLLCLLAERIRGHVSLANYRRDLIAKGEKLSAKDLASNIPLSQNGAPELLGASTQLLNGEILPNHYPPRMRLLPSGHAIVCFREDPFRREKTTNHWEQLAADLKTNDVTLAQIRTALTKPFFDNHVDLSQGAMTFPYLVVPKNLTYWFGSRIQLALHESRPRDAVEDLVAQIRLTRVLAEDHIIISELVRLTIAAIARNDTWEALQADGWTDQDLLRLQQEWENIDFLSNLARTFQGEAVFGMSAFDQMRQSNSDAVSAFFGLPGSIGGPSRSKVEKAIRDLPAGDQIADFVNEQIYCRVWRFAWIDQNERKYLNGMQHLLTITRSAVTNKSFAFAKNRISDVTEQAVNKGLYDNLRFPDLENVLITVSGTIKRTMRAETERSMVLCAIALKRYILRHGKPPETLDVLIPEFLPSIPIDFMDGNPMKYHLNTDGTFTLYSVGDDGQDNGGDSAPITPKESKSLLPAPVPEWNRKDVVWPLPATPDEIDAYRKSSHDE